MTVAPQLVSGPEGAQLEQLPTHLDSARTPEFGRLAIAEVPDVLNPYRVDNKPKELISELYNLVEQEKADKGDTNGMVAVRVNEGSRFTDVARFIEAREFKDAWYQDDSYEDFAGEMKKEYAPYEQDSKFIVLMDTDKLDEDELPVLVGMARVSGGRVDLLKTVHDTPEVWSLSQEEILADLKICLTDACDGIDVGNPATTWDYSSLAVTKDYRGTGAYETLSHEVYSWSRESGVNTITTILVKNFFDLYRFFGVPFRAICDVAPKDHMEALSIPAVMHIPEGEAMQQSPDLKVRQAYQTLANGTGSSFFEVTV